MSHPHVLFMLALCALSAARPTLGEFGRPQGFCSSCVHTVYAELPAPPRPPGRPGLNIGLLTLSLHVRYPPLGPRGRPRRGARGLHSSHDILPPCSPSSPSVQRRESHFAVAKFPPSEAPITTLLTLTSISAELKGNKQAEDIKAGMGSLGGLKKSL